ncbi:MAG: 16S rRNA (cytosine(1402)-N(4))-methyltransferase RsmH [Tepidiformaceae bacterium]
MMAAPSHTPVLLAETLQYLDLRRGGSYIDCTVGLGGHSAAIAEAMGPHGRLLCIDQDSEALEFARAKLSSFGSALNFVHGNFADLAEIAAGAGFDAVDGILMDLGVSSLQFGEAERGFAFALEGPLDMRMDQRSAGTTAGEIVNTWEASALADLFYQYGEERQSRRIAAAVVAARPLRTTWDLAKAVKQAVGGTRKATPTHPATKVFLALRIRVNRELDRVSTGLPRAHSLLGFGTAGERGGRLVVISFHSLEDRIVKQYLRSEAQDCLCPPELPVCRCGHRATLRLLMRRAVRPAAAEVAANPRARSAVLRAAERVAP